MRCRATWPALLLCAAGCLGDLVKPPGLDGGPGDGGGGPPDARLADAGDTVAWPGDLAVRVTSLVRELNDNPYPDLVLLNDPATAADRGLLVLFDRQDGFFAAPDQFLSTGSLHPLVATAEDVVGDAAPDLIAICIDESMDPYVQVFEGIAGSRFDDSRPPEGFPAFELSAGSVDSPTPVFAAAVRIRGNPRRDLVFGDLDSAVAVAPDDWDDLGSVEPFSVDVSTSMNAAAAVPSAEAGREDLFLVDNDLAWWLANDGSEAGGFQSGPATFDAWDSFVRSFFFFDLQPDGVPDVMTLDRDILDVGVLSLDGDTPVMEDGLLDPAPVFADSYGEALFAIDMDGIAGMDLLILDWRAEDSHFGLHAARNVEIAGGSVEPASRRIDLDESHVGEPTRMVAGDFDHDDTVEVWLFDAGLTAPLCLVGEIYDTDHLRFVECE